MPIGNRGRDACWIIELFVQFPNDLGAHALSDVAENRDLNVVVLEIVLQGRIVHVHLLEELRKRHSGSHDQVGEEAKAGAGGTGRDEPRAEGFLLKLDVTPEAVNLILDRCCLLSVFAKIKSDPTRDSREVENVLHGAQVAVVLNGGDVTEILRSHGNARRHLMLLDALVPEDGGYKPEPPVLFTAEPDLFFPLFPLLLNFGPSFRVVFVVVFCHTMDVLKVNIVVFSLLCVGYSREAPSVI